jgi:hypothetical protein
MTSTEEQEFIRLWNAGTETAAIAQQLGIPVGTVSSRAHTRACQGKIQPRPKGGNYPRQQALARQEAAAQVSPDTPGVSERVSPNTPSVQYLPPRQGELSPLLLEILQELRHLTGALANRVSTDTPLPAEQGKSIRRNLHLSEGLRERVKARAKACRLQDSQMVEELLWLALSMVKEGTHDG